MVGGKREKERHDELLINRARPALPSYIKLPTHLLILECLYGGLFQNEKVHQARQR